MSGVSSSLNRRSILVSGAAASAASLLFPHLAAADDTPANKPSKQGDSSMTTVDDASIRALQLQRFR